MTANVTFVTKPNCELCETGLTNVQRAAKWLRVEVRVADIGSDDDRYGQYAERLPVVLPGGGAPLLEGDFGLTDALAALAKFRIGV